MTRRVAQSLANLVHRRAEAVVKIDEGISLPQFTANLFPTDHFAGVLQQQRQQLEGLRLQTNFDAFSAQFTGIEVGREGTEADDRRLGHGPNSLTSNLGTWKRRLTKGLTVVKDCDGP
jgi:hypothetical protein